MANPNISLLGATYSGVSGVTLPKQGGGTATFPWVEGSQTVTQNGTVDVTNLAEVVVNVSGGGGTSNIVTGTFKGTNSNSALEVPISYSGSGYPVAVIIYPTEGPYNPNTGTFYNLVLRYAISMICVLKNESDTTPDYAGGTATNNKSTLLGFSKSSASSANSYSTFNKQNETVYHNSDATGSSYFKLKSKSAMSVYILGSGSNRGFAVNIEYTYHVIYSS